MTAMKRIALLMVAVSCGAVLASETYKAPEAGAWHKRHLYMKASAQYGDAVGVVCFACNDSQQQYRCQLYARNLPPRGRITVWLIDVKAGQAVRRQQVTSIWRPLRANANGVVRFRGNLEWCPTYHDEFILKYHPEGTRVDFAHGDIVLQDKVLIKRERPEEGGNEEGDR